MKKALVEPSGRVAQVEPANPDPKSGGIPFPVAPPLKWLDCDDTVVAESTWSGTSFVVPAASAASGPDVAGFITDAKAALNGIVAASKIVGAQAVFLALQSGNFADAQALIIDSHTSPGGLTDAQYAGIKSLAAKHNIPVTLP